MARKTQASHGVTESRSQDVAESLSDTPSLSATSSLSHSVTESLSSPTPSLSDTLVAAVREKLGIVFELPEVTREQLRVNPGEGLEALSDAALRRVIGSDPLGEIEPANTAIAACRREVNEAFHAVSRVLAEADQRFRRTAEKVNRIDLERVRLAKAVLAKREEARQRAKEEGARQSEGMMVGSGA